MAYGFGTVFWKTEYVGKEWHDGAGFAWPEYKLGKFSGGPHGVIKPDWYSSTNNWLKEEWPIINGNYILVGFKGPNPPADAEIPITNYKAFFNEQSTSETIYTETESVTYRDDKKLEAPTIKLILIESGIKENSFIVEAVVTGNPEPEVAFSRDDSYGKLDKYKALINMGPDSEITVIATAKNSAGSATDQINISTRKQSVVKLNIVEGPKHISRVVCWYTVEVTVEGSSPPDEVIIDLSGYKTAHKTETGTGLIKCIIGAIDGSSKCVDRNLTVTAINKNDSKNQASASIILPWIPAPEGMFGPAYDYMKISKVKGKFQMKREKERIPASNKFIPNPDPQWGVYEATGALWIGDEIKTGDETLIIEFLEDGSKFMLAPNSWMKITESGIQLKDGEGSFTITKTKDGITTLKNSFLSNFSFSAITGTSFVIDARNNRTLLKVIEGTVDIYSTATGACSTVSGGEVIDASEGGLSNKAAFSVDEEKLFWENLEKEGTYYLRENDFLNVSTIGGLPSYITVLIIMLTLLVCIALGAVIVLLKKYGYF